MVDINVTEEKIKQSVFSEIESQTIEPDAKIKVNMITLDKTQSSIESVEKFDTFRGGTKHEFFNLSRIVFQVNDKKTMETIMVGAQTAKQFQSNGPKYQDKMRDNHNSEVKDILERTYQWIIVRIYTRISSEDIFSTKIFSGLCLMLQYPSIQVPAY